MKKKVFWVSAGLIALIVVLWSQNDDTLQIVEFDTKSKKIEIEALENKKVHLKTPEQCGGLIEGPTNYGDMAITWHLLPDGTEGRSSTSCTLVGQKVSRNSGAVLAEVKLDQEDDILGVDFPNTVARFATDFSLPDCFNTLILSCEGFDPVQIFYSGR
jgi:hypothetical protein